MVSTLPRGGATADRTANVHGSGEAARVASPTIASVGAAIKYMDAESRPDFVASIYGEWWERWIPDDAPPLFLAAFFDGPLIEVSANTSLYEAWYRAGRAVELHLYSRGGHGYGVRAQALPSDAWIDRFHEWLVAEGLFPGGKP